MPIEIRQIAVSLSVDDGEDGADLAGNDMPAPRTSHEKIDPAERASIISEAVARVLVELDRRAWR